MALLRDGRRFFLTTLAFFVGAVFVWSAVGPKDRLTWLLEVLPALLGTIVLAATYRRFPLTPLAYALVAAHMIILLVGGHYTYAEVPLFNWVRDALELKRNHYDRLGHLAQGFVPALLAREVVVRLGVVVRRGWVFFFAVCVALAISAAYELLEWAAALVYGGAADAFLGTQGDPWDTQTDMFLALVGAAASQLTLGRVHDRQIAALEKPRA